MDSLGMERNTRKGEGLALAQSQHAAVMVAADMYEATYSKLFQATVQIPAAKVAEQGSSFAQVVFCTLL